MFRKSASLAAAALIPLSGVAAAAPPPFKTAPPPIETASLCQGNHCYVRAQQDQDKERKQRPFRGVHARFTEPAQLDDPPVPDKESSITQLTLINDVRDIEFGWIVAPSLYPEYHGGKDYRPHLFAFLRDNSFFGRGFCSIGIPGQEKYKDSPPCRKEDYTEESKGMRIPHLGSAVSGASIYNVTHDAATQAWRIQHGSYWIASVPDKYWGGKFVNADKINWLGEVSADQGNPCIPMGNGKYGATDPLSASATEMGYTGGSRYITAKAYLDEVTNRSYWNTDAKRANFSSFHFGGPGGPCRARGDGF